MTNDGRELAGVDSSLPVRAVLEGEFIPTPKNAPAADFYERHGFRKAGIDGNASRWVLPLAERTFAWPAFIGRAASMVQEV